MDSNANAIAFEVTLSPSREQGPDAATKPIEETEWDATNDGIKYTVKNGHLTLQYDVAQGNVAETFNTQDMLGTYQTTLTLTDLPAQQGG